MDRGVQVRPLAGEVGVFARQPGRCPADGARRAAVGGWVGTPAPRASAGHKHFGWALNRVHALSPSYCPHCLALPAPLLLRPCSHSLMCSLREEGGESQGLRGVLPPQELAALLAAEHRPLFALQVLSGVVARAWQQGAQGPQEWQQQGQELQAGSPSGQPPVGVQLAMDANLTALEVGRSC